MKRFTGAGANQPFVCLECGASVPPLAAGGYRNHCPYCLHSLHVDIDPGDRANPCRGVLEPVAVEHSQKNPGGPAPLQGDVVVIGCGNVAMDCCRTARRLLKSGRVIVAYRRIEASAPADPEEIKAARAEGVEFEFLSAPKRIIVEDGRVVGIELVRMYQTEPDQSGRRGVKPIAGSEFVIPCSTIIASIGQKMDASVFSPGDGITLSRCAASVRSSGGNDPAMLPARR